MQGKNLTFEIIPFSAELAGDFKRVNEQWIEELFELEPEDKKLLDAPQELIIDKEGEILFAIDSQVEVIGACALLKKSDKVYELTKMGVLKKARGLKAGEQLLVHILKLAKQMEIQTLYLLTNKKCEAAIHLYLKFGFRHDEEIMRQYGSLYQRCNVAMRYFPQHR